MRIWNCCSDWCKNMENELSKESDSVGLFAYCKIKYLKLHLKWTIIPAEDVVLRRRHALITVGSGYGSDGNADRCIAVIARDTDSNFYGVLRQSEPWNFNVPRLFSWLDFWVQLGTASRCPGDRYLNASIF